MATFSGAPRIWARSFFGTEYTQYAYDLQFSPTFGTRPVGAPTMVVRHDYQRVAFCTASDPFGNPGTFDGGRRINRTIGNAFDLTVPEQGVTSTTSLWATPTTAQPTSGVVPATTGPAPFWDLYDYTTPASNTVHRWTGAYSPDGTIFAALQRRRSDGQMCLSVTQNSSTLVSRAILTIKHNDSPLYSGALYRVEAKVFVFSTTKIWIIHIAESSVGAGDKALFLSVWDGTTIASTTRLGTFTVMDFEVIQGTTGLLYLMYKSESPDLNVYIRTITESSGALSAVLRTDLQGVGLDWRPGGRMPLNQAFAYKGLNYLVHAWSDRIVVYTYTTAAPSTLTLRYEGEIPFVMGFHSSYRLADTLGIEYDPVSDTAMLCFMEAYPASGGSGVETRDTRVMMYRRYTQPLDAATLSLTVQEIAPTEDYVFQPGSDTQYLYNQEMLGYIPSRTGAAGISLMIVQVMATWYSTSWCMCEVARIAHWHEPQDISVAVDVPLVPEIAVAGARDYEASVHVGDNFEIDFKAFRSRQTEWSTTWGGAADTSVNGTVNIVLQPEVTINGSIALTLNGDVAIVLQPDIYIAGTIEQTFLLTERWPAIGRTFIEEFHEYANEERATVWGRPPLKIAGENALSLDILKNLDVAQITADIMVDARWWAHDSSRYPPGWQWAYERIAYITGGTGVGTGGENLQLWEGRFPADLTIPPTALQVWTAWKNSPGHYANLMRDWGAEFGSQYTDYMFSLLSFGYGRPPEDGTLVDPDDPRYFAFYFVNVFASIKESKVEATLVQRWQKDELWALLLEHRWESTALSHVHARLEAPYSMPLHAQHQIYYPNSLVAQHTILSTHSVTAVHEAIYPNSVSWFVSAFDSAYDLQKLNAVASHELQWSRTLAAQLDTAYEDTGRVSAGHDAPYSAAPTASTALVAPYGIPIPVSKAVEAPYALQRRVQNVHVASMLMGGAARAALESRYTMENLNPVGAISTAVYSMLQPPVAVSSPRVVARLNGRTLEVDDGYITADYESAGMTFECTVNDLEFIRGARTQDILEVDFVGTSYLFFLSNIPTNSPEASAAPRVTVSGLSPIFLLDAPYAETIVYAPTTPKLFSEIIEEVLGLPVDFSRHIDWLVPYGRAQSTSQTPLALVRGFLESVGSRLLSNPDGSVYALPRYPQGFDTLPTGAPGLEFTEDDNVFVRSSTFEYARGYNRFRIRDSDTGYGDVIEFAEATAIASVWVSPYRTSWRLQCTTTPGILLDALGEEVEEKEELWDFKSGAATADYPILDLVSVTWVTDSLGGISFDPYSTRVTAAVGTNFGYGLARVVYRTKSSKFRLTSAAPIEATQLIIVEQ